MTKRILVILGHPGQDATFCRALAASYVAGAVVGGHAVRRLDLSQLSFPWLPDREAFHDREAPQSIRAAQADLLWAHHVVFFYPLWLGDMPALLKAFLEQALRPDFAHYQRPGRYPGGLLQGRSARLFVTMAMSAWVYRWHYGAPGLKLMKRHILGFCGIHPVRHCLIDAIETAGIERRVAWLLRVEEMGREGR